MIYKRILIYIKKLKIKHLINEKFAIFQNKLLELEYDKKIN